MGLKAWMRAYGIAALCAFAGCSGETSDGVDPSGQGGRSGAGGSAAASGGRGGAATAGRAGGGAGGGGRGQAGAGAGASGRAGGAGASAGGSGAGAEGGSGGAEGGSGGGGQAGSAPPVLPDPCPAGPFGDPLPPEGMRTAQPVPEGDGFDFLEGPVWIASRGVLLFSDMHMGQAGGSWPPSTIVQFTPPDDFEPWASTGSNGLAITPDGKLLACTHDMQTLSYYDLATKQRTTLPLTFEGDHFNSPNDATVRSDGTIYFTDPDWQLGGRENETGVTGVYRVPPGGEPEQFEDALQKPNGIALSPDERTLYVGSQGADLMAYELDENGAVGARRVFASPGGSDGFAVDCAGNLYVTVNGVRVFAPDGDDLGTISVGETPANVAFGGEDGRTLYITARTRLYSIRLNVPGYPY